MTSLQEHFGPFRLTKSEECQIVTGSGTVPCRDRDMESIALTSFIDSLVLEMKSTFQDRLQVRQVEGNLMAGTSFSSGCAIDGLGTFEYLSTNYPNTDYVLFYSVSDVGCNCDDNGPSTLAYATPCQIDVLGRPVVGIANFCSCQLSDVDSMSSSDRDMWFYTFLHEVTHALIFSTLLYDLYIVEDASCPSGTSMPTGWCTYEDAGLGSVTIVSDQATYIQTPKVRGWAQNHYGCDEMVGMELDPKDGAHWSGRLADNEYMTGRIKPGACISGLTLALFDDSGWYRANASFAEPLSSGKEEGCDFVNEGIDLNYQRSAGATANLCAVVVWVVVVAMIASRV